ncbi:hypothetical protein PMAYCL1PPCAC_03190, partial [Pristionchus mayeri]
YMIKLDNLEDFLNGYKSPVSWDDVKKQANFTLPQDAETHWSRSFGETDSSYYALSKECVSATTSIRLQMRLVQWQKNYRQTMLQYSDRHLEDCAIYEGGSKLNRVELLEKEGATEEHFVFLSGTTLPMPETEPPLANTHSIERNISSTQLLEKVMNASAAKHWPLYLFPRRCHDRLTRDLFDSGLLICKDYAAIENKMHRNDTIQLPLIHETKPMSPLEQRLRVESALMEFGSLEWMEWLARRLEYHNYDPYVACFYHKMIADLDYCVQDERLIRRLRDALSEENNNTALTPIEQLRMDAFVY